MYKNWSEFTALFCHSCGFFIAFDAASVENAARRCDCVPDPSRRGGRSLLLITSGHGHLF